ncbi:hypothetical protein [Natronorubrum texcoconense]|uniref:C2H2-type domain-containing protein n=1 Tax=Natronorubrum texcoconense TaxID=1095776 RepID=A0A1G9DZK8_9EURY|nr:hypothetical protein [Natronorubrum texcoconense]SDK69248.1 hypothetical protein SAMN04515672_3692 [Natronorubrum texcoconense]
MINNLRCPLCAEAHDDRTDLRVHLEVEHRKSELVATVIELSDTALEDKGTVVDENRPAPSAD